MLAIIHRDARELLGDADIGQRNSAPAAGGSGWSRSRSLSHFSHRGHHHALPARRRSRSIRRRKINGRNRHGGARQRTLAVSHRHIGVIRRLGHNRRSRYSRHDRLRGRRPRFRRGRLGCDGGNVGQHRGDRVVRRRRQLIGLNRRHFNGWQYGGQRGRCLFINGRCGRRSRNFLGALVRNHAVHNLGGCCASCCRSCLHRSAHNTHTLGKLVEVAALMLLARVNFFLGPFQSRGVPRPLHGLFLSRLLGLLLALFEPFRYLMLNRRRVGGSSNRDDDRGRGWS